MSAAVKPRIPYKGKVRRDWLKLDFPVKEYRARVKRLRGLMSKKGVQALVVYGEPLAWDRMGDVRWISGFAGIHGHAAVLIPIDGSPSLIMDGNFHGEPMHSYTWMTWIDDIRPI